MDAVEVLDLRKRFGQDTVAVDGISFSVASGEVLSLLGPSGCGKTTTLRCVAGLEEPDGGTIRLSGRDVFGGGGTRSVLPEDRGLSMVFQQYALWPHMTVFANVLFGLQARKVEKSAAQEKAKRSLQMVQLWDLRDRNIGQLSGGQQQRVAVARALAYDPEVVLLDEPLSNLDAKLREEMRLELRQLQRQFGFTALYVTHDQAEAIGLSDRVVVMNEGKIEQAGSPEEIWESPSTPFVAEFIGDSNRLEGVVRNMPDSDTMWLVVSDELWIPIRGGFREGQRAVAFVRFTDLELSWDRSGEEIRDWGNGEVALISFQGDSTLIRVLSGDAELLVKLPGGASSEFSEGQAVCIGGSRPVATRFGL